MTAVQSAYVVRRFIVTGQWLPSVRSRVFFSSSASSSSSWSDKERSNRSVPSLGVPDTDDPFLILGVSIDASESEIKNNFYQLAKRVHPDAVLRQSRDGVKNGRREVSNAAADFQKLVRAYEILSDPTRRAEYILKNPHRPRGSGSGGVGAAPPSWGGKGPSPVDVFNASLRQGRRRRAGLGDDRFAKWTRSKENTGSQDEELKGTQGAGPGGGGKAARSWDAVSLLNPGLLGRLQESFQEAMIHAYLGPYVADNNIPWAFEAEERRARGSRGRDETRRGRAGHQALHPHILEMTSGQQLLGYVESAPGSLEAFLEGMAVQEKPLVSRPGADMASKGEGEGEGGADGLCLRSQLSGMVSLPDKENFASLRVMWQGQCLGRGMRFWDSDKKEDVVLIEAFALRDNEAPRPGWFGPQAPEQTGNEDMMGVGSYVVRGLGARRLLSSHPVRHAASGAVSHVLVSHRTPLVSHFHLLQAEGGVECRVSKGDLKAYIPSEYWRFPPRSPDHDVGSWYIERTGLASPETERTLRAKLRGKMLPPVVMMLVCAFKTLDKEEQEVGKGGGPSRLQETLRGWVQRIM